MELEREEASDAASARDCVLSDFLSQPASARPRSTGEPFLFRKNISPTAWHDQERPQCLVYRGSSFTSVSSGKSERLEHDPFYLPPCQRALGIANKLQRRISSPVSSFARSGSGSGSVSPSEELSRCPTSVDSLGDELSPRASKRTSSHRIGLHRLSRVLRIDSSDNNESEQAEDSDFFAQDDYVGFTSNRRSQSRRHAYFSRLSRQG